MIGGRRMMMGRGGGQPLTRLLVHFDSASMPPADARGGAYSVTTAGQSLSAVDPKFGARSLLNAGGAGYFTPGPGISFDTHGNDWCLEAWVKAAEYPIDVATNFLSLSQNGAPEITGMSYNYTAVWVRPSVGSFTAPNAFEVSPTIWQHVAIYRIGDDIFASLDGAVSVAPGYGPLCDFVANRLHIGAPLGPLWQGGIDEVRYSVGTSRYGASNFTPPSSQFVLD